MTFNLAKQSRFLRVKCWMDGELPFERKAIWLAVQGSHPAAHNHNR